jgi:NAD(P)-dependent dehydrogenase (short-subunit alcohol dehydrogenase family)
VNAVEDSLGVPTLIIPNAATVTLSGIRTVTPQEWRREMAVNLDGAFHWLKRAHCVCWSTNAKVASSFIGSWAAHAPHPNIPAYSVAKAGMRMLCQCMALDLAPQGILVNEVAPGYVDAGLSRKIFDAQPEARINSAEQVPTRKLIEPEEVALQVAHLCEPANRHMTGSTLLMDGGLSLLTRTAQRDDDA